MPVALGFVKMMRPWGPFCISEFCSQELGFSKRHLDRQGSSHAKIVGVTACCPGSQLFLYQPERFIKCLEYHLNAIIVN